jgi:hypothetical protein
MVHRKWCPDYEQIVKEPMYFQKISARLRSNGYANAESFLVDFDKIHSNAKVYNAPGNGRYGIQCKCPDPQSAHCHPHTLSHHPTYMFM